MRTQFRSWIGFGLLASILVGTGIPARGDDAPGREIPAAYAPLEYLIGSWNGTARPAANPIRGWQESHAWAWTFEKGVPSGLSVTLRNGRLLTSARLIFDPAGTRYVLTGTGPDGKPARFLGALDAQGKTLTLDREGATSDGSKQRLTLFPNSNRVRYSLLVSEQAPGAPQFKRTVDIGLTKEGEAFAAGSPASDAPRCVVTGGTASQTVSYQGKSYPLCCSGCRDEFLADPEKYIKKAALRAAADAKAPARPAASTVNKDDGTFDGTPKPRPVVPKAATPEVAKSKADSAEPAKTTRAGDLSARAAGLLRLGQNLEKSAKPAAALGYYRRVVKEFPDTPAATTAAARIKALEAK
jgi:YHS domain-containing protein